MKLERLLFWGLKAVGAVAVSLLCVWFLGLLLAFDAPPDPTVLWARATSWPVLLVLVLLSPLAFLKYKEGDRIVPPAIRRRTKYTY